MFKLSLTMTLQAHEPAQSLTSRIARRNDKTSMSQFCTDMGIDVAKLTKGCPETLKYLARIASVDPDALKRNTIMQIEKDIYQVGHEKIRSRFLNKTDLRFCPDCLNADQIKNGKLGVHSRQYWNVRFITTCLDHGVELISLNERPMGIRASDFLGWVDHDPDAVLTANRVPVPASDQALEQYFRLRIQEGKTGSWLDTLPLEVCYPFCCHFGALVEFGPDIDRKKLTEADWRKAGAVGFNILKSGRQAFGETLARFKTPAVGATDRRKQDYLVFSTWLIGVKHLERYAAVWRLFEEYLTKHHPISTAVTNYANRTVKERYVSLDRLETEGIHFTFIMDWMVRNGKAKQTKDKKRPVQTKPITIDDMHQMKAEFFEFISAKEVGQRLGVSMAFVGELIKSGALPEVEYQQGNIRFSKRGEVAAFEEKIRRAATQKPAPSPNDLSIRDLSKKFSCKAVALFDGMFSGALTTASIINGNTGILDLHLDVEEVENFAIGDPTKGIHKSELATRLGVNFQCVDHLLLQKHLKFLKSGSGRIKSSHAIVDLKCVIAFETEYISLSKLAQQRHEHYSTTWNALRKRNVPHLDLKCKTASRIYRRSDI